MHVVGGHGLTSKSDLLTLRGNYIFLLESTNFHSVIYFNIAVLVLQTKARHKYLQFAMCNCNATDDELELLMGQIENKWNWVCLQESVNDYISWHLFLF